MALAVIGLILLFNFGFAANTEFSLASLQSGVNPLKVDIFEKQMVPINKTFGLGADLTELEKTARKENTLGSSAPNLLATKISTSIPENGVKYEVIRDEKTLNSTSTTIQQGDIIRFKPETSIGNDWIVQGASVDSPPITILDTQRLEQLYYTLYEKFLGKYPTIDWFAYSPYTDHPLQTIPKFTTETTEFNHKGNYYIADNGYPAYIVPFIGGQKTGIQIFYAPNLNTENANCKATGNVIECKITKSQNLKLDISGKSFVYIDKIIRGNKAINAGWIAIYGSSAFQEAEYTADQYKYTGFRRNALRIQIIPPGKQAPIADFECKTTQDNSYNMSYIECDTSASRDPDGAIEKYEWLTNQDTVSPYPMNYQGPHIFTARLLPHLQSLTLALRVTDNDGYYGEKTKTFQFSPNGEITNNFTLTAAHKPSTQMAEVTAECGGTVTLSIKNKITGEAEIEKVEIPCGETTPIGPFTVKGAYNVIATNNGTKAEAIFTVN